MNTIILKKPSQVMDYIASVQAFADANRKSFSFLPSTAYYEQASRGRLWVAVGENLKECMGYLFFGGRHLTLRVTQLFVAKPFRKYGIASQLLAELEAYAESNQILTITARVAADLRANNFWEKAGFKLFKQVKGGETTGRNINIRTQ